MVLRDASASKNFRICLFSRGGRGSHGGRGAPSLFANGAFFDGRWQWWKVCIICSAGVHVYTCMVFSVVLVSGGLVLEMVEGWFWWCLMSAG